MIPTFATQALTLLKGGGRMASPLGVLHAGVVGAMILRLMWHRLMYIYNIWYCWWKNPAVYPIIYRDFLHTRWLFRIFSINWYYHAYWIIAYLSSIYAYSSTLHYRTQSLSVSISISPDSIQRHFLLQMEWCFSFSRIRMHPIKVGMWTQGGWLNASVLVMLVFVDVSP